MLSFLDLVRAHQAETAPHPQGGIKLQLELESSEGLCAPLGLQ